MSSAKSVVDSVTTKENTDFSFVTILRGNYAIDFVNDAETLVELKVITGLANETDPLADLALSGDMLKDPPQVLSPDIVVENAKATVSWTMAFDKSEYALKSMAIEVVDVSFSATISLISMVTDESVDTNVKIMSARESGFDISGQWTSTFPCMPRKVEINFSSKDIIVHF